MLTILISIALMVSLAVAGTIAFDLTSGLIIGPIVGIAAFVLLLRKGKKRIESGMKEVEGHMKGQRFDKALGSLEALKPIGRWQPGLTGSIEAQIGMVRYAHMREFENARVHLEKAHARVWQAWAMLGAAHFKKERYAEMRTVFEKAVKRNKKESLLWLTYAFCEWKRGGRSEAMAILTRAQKECPSDERIKNQLSALANGKKMKMPVHEPEWLALHLERSIPVGAPTKPRFMPPAKRIGVRYTRG